MVVVEELVKLQDTPMCREEVRVSPPPSTSMCNIQGTLSCRRAVGELDVVKVHEVGGKVDVKVHEVNGKVDVKVDEEAEVDAKVLHPPYHGIPNIASTEVDPTWLALSFCEATEDVEGEVQVRFTVEVEVVVEVPPPPCRMSAMASSVVMSPIGVAGIPDVGGAVGVRGVAGWPRSSKGVVRP